MFGENVKYTTKDINDYGRKHLEEYDFIICTSCEHISDELINKLISKKEKTHLLFYKVIIILN